MANFTKQDWQNMQTALAAALARAEAAEAKAAALGDRVADAGATAKETDDLRKKLTTANATITTLTAASDQMRDEMEADRAELAKAQKSARAVDDLRKNNAALLHRLSLAHQSNQELLQKPRRKDEESNVIRRLKKRIKALEAKEPKARRGDDADQI